MSTVRLRRLKADYDRLLDYVRRHPRVKLVAATGDPPDSYQVQYELRSLRRSNEQLTVARSHLVEILLPSSYPRLPPQCRMLTPIFHPNIAPHAICIGDHWSAGEPLWGIVARIGEMIAYQTYNTKSPLNGEAARWVSEHVEQLPLDPVSMLVEDPVRPRAAPQPAVLPAPAGPPPDLRPPEAEAVRIIACPQCRAQLRLRGPSAGKRVRCPKCLTITTVPEDS